MRYYGDGCRHGSVMVASLSEEVVHGVVHVNFLVFFGEWGGSFEFLP